MNKDDKLMHDIHIVEEFESAYNECVLSGESLAKTKNVAIVGIARNVSKNISNNLKTLSTIEHLFNKCYFYIYENDSTDNSVALISEWANNKSNVVFETETLDTPHMPLSTSNIRTENLAKARNKCLEYVRSISDLIDVVIVIDLDFVNFSINGLKNSLGWFQRHEYVDAIAGFSFLRKKAFFPNNTQTNNEILTNYDSWAYRHTWWTDTQQVGLMYWFQWWIPLVGSPLIEVNSAFGGCSIYKKEPYLAGKYTGENCEHVMFHHNILKNYPTFKLFANPSQIMYVEV